MDMKFKVGDKVRNPDNKKGTIIRVDAYDPFPYKVQFEDGELYEVYASRELTLVEASLKEGDKVYVSDISEQDAIEDGDEFIFFTPRSSWQGVMCRI